jgi:hypothetical protein
MASLKTAGAQHSQSPIDAKRGGDEVTLELQPFRRCSILLTSPKNLTIAGARPDVESGLRIGGVEPVEAVVDLSSIHQRVAIVPAER